MSDALTEIVQLHSRDEGNIQCVNRYVIKTQADGRRFVLGRVRDTDYTPLPEDIYMPDFGLGLFVPEMQREIAKGLPEAARFVPYQAVAGIVEIVDVPCSP